MSEDILNTYNCKLCGQRLISVYNDEDDIGRFGCPTYGCEFFNNPSENSIVVKWVEMDKNISKQRVKDAIENHLMCMSHGVKRWSVDEVELLLKDLEIENVLENSLGFPDECFIPVVSSNIAAYYQMDRTTKKSVFDQNNYFLFIKFLNGSIYRYDTTLETIKLFELAESKGKFHNEYIKGKFEYTKIRDADKKEEST